VITGLFGNSFTSLEILLTLSQHETMFRKQLIRHFRNEKGTGAKMCPAKVSGIATGDASLVAVPEVIAKVNSAQFPLVFKVANGALFLPNANAKFSKSLSFWYCTNCSLLGRLYLPLHTASSVINPSCFLLRIKLLYLSGVCASNMFGFFEP